MPPTPLDAARDLAVLLRVAARCYPSPALDTLAGVARRAVTDLTTASLDADEALVLNYALRGVGGEAWTLLREHDLAPLVTAAIDGPEPEEELLSLTRLHYLARRDHVRLGVLGARESEQVTKRHARALLAAIEAGDRAAVLDVGRVIHRDVGAADGPVGMLSEALKVLKGEKPAELPRPPPREGRMPQATGAVMGAAYEVPPLKRPKRGR